MTSERQIVNISFEETRNPKTIICHREIEHKRISTFSKSEEILIGRKFMIVFD